MYESSELLCLFFVRLLYVDLKIFHLYGDGVHLNYTQSYEGDLNVKWDICFQHIFGDHCYREPKNGSVTNCFNNLHVCLTRLGFEPQNSSMLGKGQLNHRDSLCCCDLYNLQEIYSTLHSFKFQSTRLVVKCLLTNYALHYFD